MNTLPPFRFFILYLLAGFMLLQCTTEPASPPQIRGWNLLSSDLIAGKRALDKADEYTINHLQLSHQLIMDLKDVRNPKKYQPAKQFIEEARSKQVEDILVWDHALYSLSYYPDRFKTPEGKLNLDDTGFWKWFSDDYHSMLDSLPHISGIVLTFIETGARVEQQYSERWITEAEKLAHLVDSVAHIVIDERGLDLYIRTFMYHKNELDDLLSAVHLIAHPKVKVMSKETPHDFFLTHPVNTYVEEIDRKVLIEFDLGHEFNGQGIIASILPEITIQRWKYFSNLPNVSGYVARTDRFGDTQNIGRPTEINLYALKRIAENPELTAQEIVGEYIETHYGEDLVEPLTTLFLQTDDVILSSLYTLGMHINNHSAFDFDYESNYSRHVSGKWLEHPVSEIYHSVDTSYHYWQDIVEHLSPARYKTYTHDTGKPTILSVEAPWVLENGWVTPEDRINLHFLTEVIKEKTYSVQLAGELLSDLKKLEPRFKDRQAYEELVHLYERTHLSAQLYAAGAAAYFGYRAFINDPDQSEIRNITYNGLMESDRIADLISSYPFPGPAGQLNWANEAVRANRMSERIRNGWDTYGGIPFTYTSAR
ncbi:MAG: hypothetical protein AAFW89_04640 [Bacteroidota bacterium]